MVEYDIRAAQPIIYMVTAEEARAEAELMGIAKKLELGLKTWSCTEGFFDPKTNKKEQEEDPQEALNNIKRGPGNMIYVFKDLHTFWQGRTPQTILRSLRDIARDFKQSGKTLVLLSPVKDIPKELERDIAVVELNLPSQDALRDIFTGIYKPLEEQLGKIDEDEIERIGQGAAGLTTTEAETAFSKALVLRKREKLKEPLSALVLKEKAQAVKKSGILEYFETDESMETVGGLDNLKSWLGIRRKVFTKKAREFGLPNPRGILLVGLPGCGKSLTAKAASNILQVPLIRFDIGKVFGGLVGMSEANARDALKTIDAIGNCVTGDTEVVMSDGSLKRIDQIRIGDKVACYREDSGKIAATRVCWAQSKKREVLALTNKSGDKVKATPDHRFLVLDHGKIRWREAGNLRLGDLVGVPKRLPYVEPTTQDLLPKEVRVYGVEREDRRVFAYVRCDAEKYPDPYMPKDRMTREEWLAKPSHRVSTGAGRHLSQVPDLPSRITSQMAYIGGLVASDGSLGTRHIGFTNARMSLHQGFCDFFSGLGVPSFTRQSLADEKYGSYKSLPGISANPQLSTIFETKVNRKLLAQVVRALNERVLELGPGLLAWWLAGYIDGDGTTSLPQHDEKIAICSKRPRKAKLVREVIRRLGIVPPAWDGRIIEVTGQRARDLALLLNGKVSHPNKSRNIQAIIRSNKQPSRRDSGFKLGRLLRSQRRLAGKKSTEMLVGTGTVSRAENNLTIGEAVVQQIATDLPNAGFDKLLNSDVRWVPITKIEQMTEEVVYDISCEGDHTHSFIANGMIAHNCVVWIDEMEKAFAGMGGSGSQDSGVSQRVFGTIITWMQEKKSPSFIVATVNNIGGLPSELLRKGRFDEIFFVGLPSAKEREEITKIHVNKFKRDPSKVLKRDLKSIVSDSEGFSGAELEEAVVSGLYSAFDRGTELKGEYIHSAVLNTTPLSKSREEQLAGMKEWAEKNAVHASKNLDKDDKSGKIRQLKLN